MFEGFLAMTTHPLTVNVIVYYVVAILGSWGVIWGTFCHLLGDWVAKLDKELASWLNFVEDYIICLWWSYYIGFKSIRFMKRIDNEKLVSSFNIEHHHVVHGDRFWSTLQFGPSIIAIIYKLELMIGFSFLYRHDQLCSWFRETISLLSAS